MDDHQFPGDLMSVTIINHVEHIWINGSFLGRFPMTRTGDGNYVRSQVARTMISMELNAN